MRGVVVAADLAQRVEAHHLRVGKVAQSVHVEHEYLAQLWQPGAHLERLVELLVVLDEQVDRARIRAEILDLRGRVGRIDAVRHPAGAQDAHVGIEPFAVGVGQHRGAFARRKAERHQPHADLARVLAELAPGDALPDAEMLLPQADLRAPFGRAAPEHLRNGVSDRLCGRRHRQSFLRFHRRVPRTPPAFMPR